MKTPKGGGSAGGGCPAVFEGNQGLVSTHLEGLEGRPKYRNISLQSRGEPVVFWCLLGRHNPFWDSPLKIEDEPPMLGIHGSRTWFSVERWLDLPLCEDFQYVVALRDPAPWPQLRVLQGQQGRRGSQNFWT